MACIEVSGKPWTRKHDNPAVPLFASVPVTAFPNSLECLIELCASHAPADRLKAAGSHWALSEAAISDRTFVETHDPTNTTQAMGRTLDEVVPGCLDAAFYEALKRRRPAPYDREHKDENTGLYPVHFETGKRVFQLYSELDLLGDTSDPFNEVMELAAALKKENPARTAAQVQRILRAQSGWAPDERTIQRMFHRTGLTALTAPDAAPVFGRFEADRPNEIWTGDALHAIRLDGRKTYLFAFIDDHSRAVMAARFGFAEDTIRLAAALRPALASRGVPEHVYVEYVPRNIFRLLCPAALCGSGGRLPW